MKTKSGKSQCVSEILDDEEIIVHDGAVKKRESGMAKKKLEEGKPLFRIFEFKVSVSAITCRS